MSLEYCAKCKSDVVAITLNFGERLYQWECPICHKRYTITYKPTEAKE